MYHYIIGIAEKQTNIPNKLSEQIFENVLDKRTIVLYNTNIEHTF